VTPPPDRSFHGRQRRWVFLRGLSRARGHWGSFAEDFRGAFPDAIVELPDLPGTGERRGVRAPLSIAATLDEVRAALATEGPVWLVGLSMGSMAAFEWMRRYPAEVAGAVLINTSLGGLSRPWRRLRFSAAVRLLRATAATDPRAREQRVFDLTSTRPDLAGVTVSRWAELAHQQPVRRINVARQLLAAARYRPRPFTRPIPALLLLTSRGDRLVDPECSRALARAVPGATLLEHPSAGHDLPLDDPAWVLQAIASWHREQEKGGLR
jgi:pimeloyl-ACP methyl ester carboxylesterase